jgi:hypothetical protein
VVRKKRRPALASAGAVSRLALPSAVTPTGPTASEKRRTIMTQQTAAKKCLELIRSRPGITAAEIPLGLRFQLKELEDRNEIKYDGDGWSPVIDGEIRTTPVK